MLIQAHHSESSTYCIAISKGNRSRTTYVNSTQLIDISYNLYEKSLLSTKHIITFRPFLGGCGWAARVEKKGVQTLCPDCGTVHDGTCLILEGE